VQYIDTGVLLDVVPRVNPGGLVYMDIQQVVSKPTTKDQYGNYTIANRALSTEVAVQSGQTVLLGGLIQQSDTNTSNGVPFLSRIPILGRLFGTTEHDKSRTELIVLITPRVVRNADDARRITDEYENKFQSLKPILHSDEATPATTPAPPTSAQEPQAMPAPVAAPAPTPATSTPAHGASASAAPAEGFVPVATFAHHDAAERLRRAVAGNLHGGGMLLASG
jgi:general secretion pathway protein D